MKFNFHSYDQFIDHPCQNSPIDLLAIHGSTVESSGPICRPSVPIRQVFWATAVKGYSKQTPRESSACFWFALTYEYGLSSSSYFLAAYMRWDTNTAESCHVSTVAQIDGFSVVIWSQIVVNLLPVDWLGMNDGRFGRYWRGNHWNPDQWQWWGFPCCLGSYKRRVFVDVRQQLVSCHYRHGIGFDDICSRRCMTDSDMASSPTASVRLLTLDDVNEDWSGFTMVAQINNSCSQL